MGIWPHRGTLIRLGAAQSLCPFYLMIKELRRQKNKKGRKQGDGDGGSIVHGIHLCGTEWMLMESSHLKTTNTQQRKSR